MRTSSLDELRQLCRGIRKSFVHLETRDSYGNAVAPETPTAAIKITRPNEIAQYAAMFDHLHHEAVHGQHARQLIAAILAGL